jgi:FtsZ-binding cell division protein ZapB
MLAVSFAIVIVMLNLLIAIISDSFEKVMAIDRQATLFEKLQLIIEFKRQADVDMNNRYENKNFLCVVKAISEEDDVEDSEDRIRNKIIKLESSIEGIKKLLSSEIGSVRAAIVNQNSFNPEIGKQFLNGMQTFNIEVESLKAQRESFRAEVDNFKTEREKFKSEMENFKSDIKIILNQKNN